ncbi:MAG: tetraacyldisaccharide 4'-kinase [Coxiella sp. RIFCSPHIGHO2_12_FULL_42_15]|nr:MAG: tetraacyldisaccharide 4'-kinase [Coxiella sp. RIFCSPHIGHO2_12_FULL_42_15]
MYALIGLAGLYRFMVYCRAFLYRLGLKHRQRFPVPVIVVGNISVGGTGKTPLVAWLIHFLQKQGYRPGIVSRGYGASGQHWPKIVTAESHPEYVGDEPLMLKLQTGCPVVVAPNRIQAAQRLLASGCNVIISDDGLQHYALVRDIEIAVIDGERRLGNGFCLPMGPLREAPSRLRSVDFIVCNGEPRVGEFSMRIVPQSLVSLCDAHLQITIAELASQKIIAVAGIGHPERFFKILSDMGLPFKKKIFRDHHRYQKKDFDFVGANDIVVMTEKDAVKCRSFADRRFYMLPIMAVLGEDFSQALRCKLQSFAIGARNIF